MADNAVQFCRYDLKIVDSSLLNLVIDARVGDLAIASSRVLWIRWIHLLANPPAAISDSPRCLWTVHLSCLEFDKKFGFL